MSAEMIALFCLVLLGGTHEIEPIEYRMIPSAIVYDEDINAEDEWFGFFYAACGSMPRLVEFELILEDVIVYEGERPAGWMLEFRGETQEPLPIRVRRTSGIISLLSGPEIWIGTAG